jgi:fructuronate reductase
MPSRLSARTMQQAQTSCLPDYDRSPTATITHLGFGAFARAHLGVYADDLCHRGWPSFVRGVSLHSDDVVDQLAPQDCLYTVAEREPQTEPALSIIGSISSIASGPAAALDAVNAPGTRLVTLTITEKGYDLDEADVLRPDRPRSALGILALALSRYRDRGSVPPIIASLDNVMDNGNVLRSRVSEIASHLDGTLPDWINETVRFPNSVVDRMVPAITDPDLKDISTRLGLVDRAAVTTEQHRSWVMSNVDGLLPLGEVGVELVADIGPYERRKLWLLNGPHSAFAYCGILAGCLTIAEATDQRRVATFVRKLVDDILLVAGLPASVQAEHFAADALRRFQNPNLGHTCAKVAADGSHKLPQRFRKVVKARLDAGLDTARFALVVALWAAVASNLEIQGSVLPTIEDPVSTLLRRAAEAHDPSHLARVALEDAFDERFTGAVAQALARLPREGMRLVEELT